MIQSVLYQFAEVKEADINGQKQQHVYLFTITPGAPWEHIYESLDAFKAKVKEHEAEALSLAAKKAEQEAEIVIEPEIVQESPISE